MSDEQIPSDDRSFLYGDGLFETVRVREDGSVRWLGWHVERFERSARWLGFSEEQIEEGAHAIEALRGERAGIWRVTVSREQEDAPFGGSGGVRTRFREHQARERPALALAWDWYRPGDPFAEHKSTSYLRSVESLRRARAEGYDDAVTVSADGHIGECAWANVVVVVDGEAYTPPADGILPGVTRRGVLELYPVTVDEVPVTVDMLREADEVAMLSAGVGALAAASIEGRELDGEWTERLGKWLEGVGR
jgi:branched-chain amino acid aminotransferase